MSALIAALTEKWGELDPVAPKSPGPCRRYTEIGTSTHDRCEQVAAALNLPAAKGKPAEDVPQPLRHFPRCGYPVYE
ncbi:MAG: hypothetical protein QOJ20_5129 [Mycobacterium sp.]|jgi:hypothetical protein|nr:hypothetical protein [Mycobacterium sp.]